MNIIVETGRLQLREICADDLDALGLVLSDADTMRYYPHPFDRDGVIQWIERNQRRYLDDGCGLYTMILKGTGELIGDCGLTRQQVDGVTETEVGYHVRRDLWGRGYATEAATACLRLGFHRFGAPRIIALIRPENLQSRRVAEKVGMTIARRTIWHNLVHFIYATNGPSTTNEPTLFFPQL